jgi:predicted amino acid-binding ACT domain protein
MSVEWQDPNGVVGGVLKALRDGGRKIAAVPAKAVRKGTFALLAMVQKRTPKKTATLVRSLRADVTESGTLVEGRIGTQMKYALPLEVGTGVYGPRRRPVVVTARARMALFWGATGADGKRVFAKRVSIRGIRPRRMFGSAVEEFLPLYVPIIEQELEAEAKR